MTQSSDIVVIGAGIAGAATAFHLAGMGTKVTLIERDHPASGPTGNSTALCHLFYTMPELSRLARRGVDWLRKVPEFSDYPPVLHETGMLWCAGEENAAEWAEAVRRIREEEGGAIETLTPEEFAKLAPNFRLDDIVLGVWEPTYGYGDPYDATNAFVAAARHRGATVRMRTRVRGLDVGSGKIKGVELEDSERIAADIVVAAAGPWTKALIGQLGVELPLHIERHAMAVLHAPGDARSILPFGWCDDILSHYARPEGENTILIGIWAGGGTGARNPVAMRPPQHADPNAYDAGSNIEEGSEIAQLMVPRLPELERMGLRPGYACLYDMSPDDLPVIDQIPGADGLYCVAGSSGHGLKLGPAVGEEVAGLVTGGRSELLKPFSLARFS